MKDIMQKLAELEATAPKITKKKMLNEDSATPPMNVSNKPASFKDVFENMAAQKPIPVVGKQGDTQSTGAGFLNINDTSPAGQAMQKALTDLAGQGKAQIVVPTDPQNAPAQAGAAGVRAVQTAQGQSTQPQVQEVDMGQAEKGMRKSTPHRGKYKVINSSGKTVSVHDNQGAAMRAAMKNDDYSVKAIKEKKLDEKFASQQQAKLMYAAADDTDVAKKTGVSQKVAKEFVKKSHGQKVSKLPKKVKEGDIAPTSSIDTKGAGLGAGRSQTTLEGKKDKIASMPIRKFDATYGKKKSNDADAFTKNKSTSTTDKKVDEGKKPDFLDLDKDGNKKEPMKKAAADKKKQKVKESMNHKLSAARLEGKTHGLRGNAYHGKAYEDLEEMKAYHEGYKEGLDECYGQGVYEDSMPATVPGMASSAMSSTPTMEDEMEEGNAFTAALANTPKGGKFSVGGKTYTDRSNIDEYAFEAWDRELNNLLNEDENLNEGLSVSVSKGQQNSPDSVTITAQDAEADQLLQLVKHAGLGLFGDEQVEPSSAMSVQPSLGDPDEVGSGGVDVEVVDGHDGMMGLMQKLSGVASSGSDYEDEESSEEQLYGNHADTHEETHEETCNECGGMMEAEHSCGSKMDEEETPDQEEFEVAEDNAPDSDEAETSADEDAEAEEDKALAGAASGDEEEIDEGFTFESIYKKFAMLEGSGDKPKNPEHDEKDDKDFDDAEEEEVSESKESTEEKDEKAEKAGKKVTKDIEYDDKKEKIDEWANDAGKKGTDASFEQDIDFMTKVISGGLNKPKSTGQTTVPVIAGQTERMTNPKETVTESVSDWVKLAGIKKS